MQPNLPEAHLALGYCIYYGDRNYERALQEFAIAQAGLPNDADIYVAIAAIDRRKGQWAQSIANFEKAASLDPKNAIVLENLGLTYQAVRDYPAAARAFEAGIAAAPDSLNLAGADVEVDWKGDLGPTKAILARLPPDLDPDGRVTLARLVVALMERKFSEAFEILKRNKRAQFQDDHGAPLPRGFVEGEIHRLTGDAAKARALGADAIEQAEAAVREAPQDPWRHANLGRVYALAGRPEAAVGEGKRAIELLPESLDAFDGPGATLALAEIYAVLDEVDFAVPLLEHSLATPNGTNPYRLKLEPIWDSLRDDARFKQSIAKNIGPP